MGTDHFDTSGFGRKIKKLRKAKGLSQEELAERIDRTVDTVSNIERGVSAPRLETVYDLAAVLDVPLHILLQQTDAPPVDRDKEILLDDIIALLRDQPADIASLTRDHIRYLISIRQNMTGRT